MRRLPTLMVTTMIMILTASLFSPVSQAAPGFRVTHRTIPGTDGVALDAKVIEPTGRGDGPFPVLVMPTSWATPNIQYVGAAADLAYNSGYVVVSYTARGFYQSGGGIEVAAAEDAADASKVIDWTLANTHADPRRVGMAGMSYGAGISALTSAADPRVRAVAAMSGWADLANSLYPNRTVASQTVEMLLGAAHVTGRFGDDLRELESAYRENRLEDALHLAPERSPATKVDGLNANGTAVMIANAWEDSMFPPKQMTELYEQLRGPKRLMLSPGDHASPELFGAAGIPNEIWDSTKRWFDHHLRGGANGIDAEAPVQLKPMNGGQWRGYSDWASVTGDVDTRYLGRPQPWHVLAPGTGTLAHTPQPDWSNGIAAGGPTLADTGPIMISGMLQGFFNIPTGVAVPLVDRRAAGVWATDPYPTSVTVSGTPRLRTTITPDAEQTSLFGYLYDVDQFGLGSLITHKPMTLGNLQPGQPRQIDVNLEPGLWEVPAGHRIVLVVDTVDPRYRDRSAEGSQVTFNSTTDSPSRLDIPLG